MVEIAREIGGQSVRVADQKTSLDIDRGGSIDRLDAQTGKIRKHRPFQDGWGKLLASSNVIFASSKEGAAALAPNTLETLWTTPLPGLQPLAVANGRLYAAAGARIVAFGNGKRKGEGN